VTVEYAQLENTAALDSAARELLGIPTDASLKLMHRGKKVECSGDISLASSGIAPGAKLLAMHSSAASLSAVATAQPERMRGFEEDDERTQTGGLGGRAGVAARKTGSSRSEYCFGGTDALQVPAGIKHGRDAALQLLHKLSTDPAILAIMAEHRWTVGTLKEMPPEGLVGVSASCLMGLNRNRGQEIILRLRTDDWGGLRPYTALIPVLLHELTHNVFDDHDNNFKALNSQLGREYALHRSRLGRGSTLGSGEVLERGPATATAVVAAAGATTGGSSLQLSPRAAAAQAALERATSRAPTVAPAVAAEGGECMECDPQAEGEASRA